LLGEHQRVPASATTLTSEPVPLPSRRLASRARRFGRALFTQPRDALGALREEFAKRKDHPEELAIDDSWEERLHGLLGAPWPCPDVELVTEIWSVISDELRSRGISFGRFTYGEYSDADLFFARAVWCSVTHLRAEVVVETGVAHGVTSRVILEALSRMAKGHLWSIDQPHLFDPTLRVQTGAAVPEALRSRWTYVEGSSRSRLPAVLRSVGHVDVFIHDSLHTARNTSYEMSRAFPVLTQGGVMIIDDISMHQGFRSFLRSGPDVADIVCRSADGLGLFGIAQKAKTIPELPTA
jgi:hypothetical protein